MNIKTIIAAVRPKFTTAPSRRAGRRSALAGVALFAIASVAAFVVADRLDQNATQVEASYARLFAVPSPLYQNAIAETAHADPEDVAVQTREASAR